MNQGFWSAGRGYGVPASAAVVCLRGDNCAFELGQSAYCSGCFPRPTENIFAGLCGVCFLSPLAYHHLHDYRPFRVTRADEEFEL